MVVNAVYP